MTRRPRLLLAAAVIIAAAAVTPAAAQTGGCPPGTQPVTEPQQEGGRLEYCQRAGSSTERDGPVRTFYADGQKRFEGEFRDGKPYGRWRGWYASGRPEGEADFGTCELTRMVSWYEDGKPFYELDAGNRRARVFDQYGREIPDDANRTSLRHPPFVQTVLAAAFFLGKVCPP